MSIFDDLGVDADGRVSSLSTINRGSERGFRKRETSGSWSYVAGYDEHAPQREKYAHVAWASRLNILGHRVGVRHYDGSSSFYVFVKS